MGNLHCAPMGLDRWYTCTQVWFCIQVKPNHIYKVGNDFKKYFDEHFLSCQLTQASRTAQFCSILAVRLACVSWQFEKCSSKYFLKSFPTLYIWFGLTWMWNRPRIQVHHLSRPSQAQWNANKLPFLMNAFKSNYIIFKLTNHLAEWRYIWKLPTFSTMLDSVLHVPDNGPTHLIFLYKKIIFAIKWC